LPLTAPSSLLTALQSPPQAAPATPSNT